MLYRFSKRKKKKTTMNLRKELLEKQVEDNQI